jgi:hypothetical protein
MNGPVAKPKSWVRGSALAAAAGLCGPAGAWMVRPVSGMVITGVEVSVALAVLLTALFGSTRYSNRAFRLLRWAFDRAEPPPAVQRTAIAADERAACGLAVRLQQRSRRSTHAVRGSAQAGRYCDSLAEVQPAGRHSARRECDPGLFNIEAARPQPTGRRCHRSGPQATPTGRGPDGRGHHHRRGPPSSLLSRYLDDTPDWAS